MVQKSPTIFKTGGKMENVIKLDYRKIKGQPVISSKEIAKAFGKKHKHVLRAINQLEIGLSLLPRPSEPQKEPVDIIEKIIISEGLNKSSIEEILLSEVPAYLLCLGFTGREALQLKLEVVHLFLEAKKAQGQDTSDIVETVASIIDESEEYMQAARYLTLKGMYKRGISQTLGQLATEQCNDLGLEIRSRSSKRYSKINSYPISVLDQIWGNISKILIQIN